MKNKSNFCLIAAFALAMLTSCGHSSSSPKIQLTWQHLGNDVERGVCESRFTITNLSEDTLFADWKIFYNQMSVAPIYNDTAALNVIQIQASYHVLVPTEFFHPLAPGESVTAVLRYKGTIMRRSGGPCGPFVVFDGQSQPEDVALQNVYSDDAHEFRRHIATFPYADGEWMWEQNNRFSAASGDACSDTTYGDACSDTTCGDACGSVSKVQCSGPINLLPTPKQIKYFDGKIDLAKAVVSSQEDLSLPHDGYKIIAQNDSLTIYYNNSCGEYYAQQTLAKIHENMGNVVTAFQITDYPDIAHRGFMLDISRNYTAKEEILRLIDILSSYKMNVLHLHLTDDEGWRIEIPGLPELTEVGSRRGYTTTEHDCLYPMYSGGWNPNDKTASGNGYLTRSDYIEILKYAKARYVNIVPEIDMPGHSRAAIKAMEARYYKYIDTDSVRATEYLLSDFADTSRYVSAQHYTDNVICIALPSCYNFAKKVIDEIVSMYCEADAPLHIFHVGGDEVPRGAWLGSPKVAEYVAGRRAMENNSQIEIVDGQKSDAKSRQQANEGTSQVTAVDVANLKDSFLESIIAILDEYGLQIAGWEEIAYRGGQPNPRFANRNAMTYTWNSVPEWRGDEKPYILANAGYPVMVCCVTNLYLDMCYLNHEDEQGLNWGGYVDEYQSFLLRPSDLYRSVERTMLGKKRDLEKYASSDKVALIPDSAKNIKGIQAQLWAETIRDSQQLERYLFPKLLGVAERGWNENFDFYKREQILCDYNTQLWQYELPSLHRHGIAFHLTQPGIHIDEDGLVSMNCPATINENCIIRYTTDGTTPDEQSSIYSEPFSVPADCHLINAKAFLLGEQSNTTHQIVN